MSAPLTFTFEPLHQILPQVRAAVRAQGEARLLVPNPDLAPDLYPGEVAPSGRHRPLQVWLDLADRLECHLLTPVARGAQVELTLKRAAGPSLHTRERHAERYGAESGFQRIDKLEDPIFLDDMLDALGRAHLRAGARVLDVGVNGGGELRLLDLAYPGHDFAVTGVDLSESALSLARARYPRHDFRHLDVNDLPNEGLGRFDLILSVGTLQSSGVNGDRVLRALLRDHLAPGGSVILALPNCRYEGGRVSYGARLLNSRKPDLSLLVKDLALQRRHLQKHGFRVTVSGKYDVVLTAVPVTSAP